MSRNSRAEFYWKDWRSDQGLSLCSLAAQGLWMRLLCIAAEADPIGYVLVDGSQPTHADIAKLVGTTEVEINILVAELEKRAVFSRNRAGIIYSRRMVRDEKKKKIARQNGKTGGNPTLKKQKIIQPPDNPTDKSGVDENLSLARARPLLPLTTTTSPNTTLTTQGGTDKAPVEDVCEALGVTLTASAERLNWPGMVRAMIDSGLSLAADILPACAEAKSRGIANLAWVRKRAEGEQAKRNVAAQASAASSANEAHKWRMEFLKNYNLPVPDEDVGEMVGVPKRFVDGRWVTEGCWRWIKNTSGNGAWQDAFGVGPPPHDPRTLVTEKELDFYPGARAMRDKLRGASH